MTGSIPKAIPDENRVLINVWMQSEDESRQNAETRSGDYDAAFEDVGRKFNMYKHHHFDDGWRLYSEDDAKSRKDEEWFLRHPQSCQRTIPSICATCAEILTLPSF